jgi:hypothetical protein
MEKFMINNAFSFSHKKTKLRSSSIFQSLVVPILLDIVCPSIYKQIQINKWKHTQKVNKEKEEKSSVFHRTRIWIQITFQFEANLNKVVVMLLFSYL